MSADNIVSKFSIYGNKSPFFFCDIDVVGEKITHTKINNECSPSGSPSRPNDESSIESRDEQEISDGTFGLSSSNWTEILTALYGFYDTPIVRDQKTRFFSEEAGLTDKDFVEQARVWAGFYLSDEVDFKAQAMCTGRVHYVNSSDAFSEIIGNDFGKVFLILPKFTDKHAQRKYVRVNFSLKNKDLEISLDLKTEQPKLLFCTREVDNVEFETSQSSTVSFMKNSLYQSGSARYFDFTPIPRDPEAVLLWKALDNAQALEDRYLSKLAARLGVTIRQIGKSQSNFHLVYLTSVPGKSNDYTATDSGRVGRPKIGEHKELHLDIEESAFYRACKRKFPQVACILVSCTGRTEETDVSTALTWRPRQPINFELDAFNSNNCEVIHHHPYPMLERLYGYRWSYGSESRNNGKFFYTEGLYVMALAIKK